MWFLYFVLLLFLFSSLFTYCLSVDKRAIPENSISVSSSSFFLFCTVSLIIFFSSLRLPVSDTEIYKDFFETISATKEFVTDVYFEPGYQIFNKIISLINDDFVFYLFVFNIVVWISICSFLKRYSRNVIYSMCIFLFLGYLDQTFNLLRQYLAISVVLYSFRYVISRCFLKFLFITVFASFFHSSAIIFIIAYPLYLITVKRTNLVLCLYTIGALLCYIFSDKIYSLVELTKYGNYLESDLWAVQESVKIAPLFNFLILYLVILLSFKVRGISSLIDNVIFNIVLVGSYITILSFRFTLMERVGYYFTIFSVVLLTNSIAQIRNVRKKQLLYLFFFLLLLARYIIIAIYRPDWACVYPYKFYFQ